MGIGREAAGVEKCRMARLHYAWVVAGITFLALIASAGIGATRAVLVLPLEREFGWDRATVSLALSINLLLFGLCGPFAGALMTRFGVRRVMLTALVTLGTSVTGTDRLFLSSINANFDSFTFRANDKGLSIVAPSTAKLTVDRLKEEPQDFLG